MMVTSSLMSATDQQQLKQITASQIASKANPPNSLTHNEKMNLPTSTGKIIAGISNQVTNEIYTSYKRVIYKLTYMILKFI